jgi:predicted RNA binding protein YcfA (HicA-like mRNA interferase family)
MIAKRAAELTVAWSILRTRGDHDVYSLDGLRIILPRHREISSGTAGKILKDTEEKLGEGWWR